MDRWSLDELLAAESEEEASGDLAAEEEEYLHDVQLLLCGRCTGQLADVDGTTRLCNKERKSVSTLRRLMVLRFGRLGQCCSRDPAPRRRFGLQQAFTIHDSWF